MEGTPHFNVRRIAVFFSGILWILCGFTSSASGASLRDQFEAGKYENAKKQTMPYRLLRPMDARQGNVYPLVLFLHGIGERGTNNSWQLNHGVCNFAKADQREKYPCFVLAPQCPLDDCWVPLPSLLFSRSMREKPTGSLSLAMELCERLAAELPIDRGRVYITGLSMGGFGVWDAISRWPDRFAAALPICGGGDPLQAPKLTALPLWAFHGDSDKTISCRRTVAMIDAIRKSGGAPKMNILPDAGHMCWDRVYNDTAALEWLFSQHKAIEPPRNARR